MLDPASSVEMVKVLEEDPMVGGVGGDVQVHMLCCLHETLLVALLVMDSLNYLLHISSVPAIILGARYTLTCA
jgi:hypothetical protein